MPRIDRATLGLLVALAGAGLALWSVPVGVTGTFIGLMLMLSDRARWRAPGERRRQAGGSSASTAGEPARAGRPAGERFRELQAKRKRRRGS